MDVDRHLFEDFDDQPDGDAVIILSSDDESDEVTTKWKWNGPDTIDLTHIKIEKENSDTSPAQNSWIRPRVMPMEPNRNGILDLTNCQAMVDLTNIGRNGRMSEMSSTSNKSPVSFAWHSELKFDSVGSHSVENSCTGTSIKGEHTDSYMQDIDRQISEIDKSVANEERNAQLVEDAPLNLVTSGRNQLFTSLAVQTVDAFIHLMSETPILNGNSPANSAINHDHNYLYDDQQRTAGLSQSVSTQHVSMDIDNQQVEIGNQQNNAELLENVSQIR